MKKYSLLFCILATMMAGCTDLYDLRCEGLTEPLAIDNTFPRFSWKHHLDHDNQRQTAYEIQVATDVRDLLKGKADLWSSGKVGGDDQLWVPYKGKQLRSRQLAYWRVRTWSETGKRSRWSKPQRFAIGVLSGMQGEYIGIPGDVTKLRKTLKIVDEKSKTVLAHLNSLGYHELWVNGRRVGDEVLQPAMSQMDRHSLIVTYDITPYLHHGDNELVVWIAKGWWRANTYKAQYDHPLLRAEVDELEGGEWAPLAVTDASWEATVTGRTYTGTWWPLQFGGEQVDANVQDHWVPANVYEVTNMRATPQLFAGNHITDEVHPVSITKEDDGSKVFDLGRIVVGWLRMEMGGLEHGDTVRMEYTDYIPVGGTFESQGEGDIYIANGTGDISKGHGETFENRFHTHAFRYVRVKGAPAIEDLAALQISALPKESNVSTFTCDDERLNAVHDMIHYTMECLTFSGYMVDCPHLERTGYGGDGNSSTVTLQTMFDVNDTYMNWLDAWLDNIDDNGSVPHVAPAGGGGGGPYWCGFVVKAPWRTYLNYGDRRPMERMYEGMKRWLQYVDDYTVDGLLERWPDTDNRMWFLGDWLAPAGVDVGGESVIHSNNCFISMCLGNVAKMAHVLGHLDDALRYEAAKVERNRAIHRHFFHDNYYANGTPLDMAAALLAGVADQAYADIHSAGQTDEDENLRIRVCDQLVKNYHNRYNDHIAAGLFGVPIVTEWAIKSKHADLMADILRQPDYPGYLHMIANGATATWESWDGSRSRVHNCYNGVGTWFYQALAGILPDEDDPGYHHFYIDPQYVEGVNRVTATKPTPYGPVEVHWERIMSDEVSDEMSDEAMSVGEVAIDVSVPVGTTATLYFPAVGQKTDMFREDEDVHLPIYDGIRLASDVPGTKLIGYIDGKAILNISPGHHHFAFSPLKKE